MVNGSATNWLAFKGFMTPFFRRQAGQLSLHAIWFNVTKVTPNGGFDARQKIFSTIKLISIALAENTDGEAADWLVGTFDCGKEFGINDKEKKERDRTS